jgi:hypothetical protein
MALNDVERNACVNTFDNSDIDTILGLIIPVVRSTLLSLLWTVSQQILKWFVVGIIMLGGAAIIILIQQFKI